MKRNDLAVNTLVFLEDLQKGTPQADMLEWISGCGVHKAEIRREFIADFDTELRQIRAKAEALGMELFYSVPDTLFAEGKLKGEKVESYLFEAKAMGCHHVKLTIGAYGVLKPAAVQTLNALCERDAVALTVENDQTAGDGRLEKLRGFLEEAAALGGDIGMTFDVGNWLWQKESPLQNAEILSRYTTYIHLKDAVDSVPPRTTLLGDGSIDWRAVLNRLPAAAPVALEYPCPAGGLPANQRLDREIRKALTES